MHKARVKFSDQHKLVWASQHARNPLDLLRYICWKHLINLMAYAFALCVGGLAVTLDAETHVLLALRRGDLKARLTHVLAELNRTNPDAENESSPS